MLLACLDREPAHGYRIIELMREASGGVFELAEGTIYPALRRLEREGLVASTWTTGPGDRRRRTYSLTARGTAELAAHQVEWRSFATAVSNVLLKGETWATTT